MTMRELLTFSRPLNVQRGGNPIVTFQDEVNKLFSDFFGESSLPAWRNLAEHQSTALSPAVDISETDKEYKITAELPGLDVKDVQITAAEGYVTIRGEKKEETREEKEGYFRRERSYGSFQRVIALPDMANMDKAEAKMDKGVLVVSIAKKAAANPKERKIEVKQAA